MHDNIDISSQSVESLQFGEELMEYLYFIPPRMVRVELQRLITDISIHLISHNLTQADKS